MRERLELVESILRNNSQQFEQMLSQEVRSEVKISNS